MKIAVVGTGYVGLVNGACFAEMGNQVTCVDIDAKKIAMLLRGEVPIYEPGLESMVQENLKLKSLSFTTNLEEALRDSEIAFIAVGTPMGEDGSADLRYVLQVADDIGRMMSSSLIVVNKSTVPVGTADKVRQCIVSGLAQRADSAELLFDVVSNPEFLKEGAAIHDFMKPDRIIIGADNPKSLEVMRELYRSFNMSYDRLITMDIRSAEMTKYAANAMLATKISFMNEIANICERVGADANMVRNGIGADSRIGYKFIYPGCGYGGSCFPKDVQALLKTAADNDYHPQILTAVEAVNKRQKLVLVNKIKEYFSDKLEGLTFAIWGLSFKPGTDDMRDAPAIQIIKELVNCGAKCVAYDPEATSQAKDIYLKDLNNISYKYSKYDVLNGADAMILITEWKEFRSPDFTEMAKRLKSSLIFDGRNQYNAQILQKHGFDYHQIGVAKN